MFELTYNYGKDSYEKGNAYAQVAISTKVRAQLSSANEGPRDTCSAYAPRREIFPVLCFSHLLIAPCICSLARHMCLRTPTPHPSHPPHPPIPHTHRLFTYPPSHIPSTPPQDVYKSAEQIKAAGGNVTREPGPVPGIGTKILACTDPDGYKIGEPGQAREPGAGCRPWGPPSKVLRGTEAGRAVRA